MAITTPRNVTYILNVDGYHIGDGVQLSPERAAVLVADGTAVYSENYQAPTSELETRLAALEAEAADHEARIAALE